MYVYAFNQETKLMSTLERCQWILTHFSGPIQFLAEYCYWNRVSFETYIQFLVNRDVEERYY